MRDARINMIGEGANDVLRVFSALVGMRDVGLELESILNAIKSPLGNLTKLGHFAGRQFGSLFVSPQVYVSSNLLEDDAGRLARTVASLGKHVKRLLATYQKDILDAQHQLGRVADTAIELYVSACVLGRMDQMLRRGKLSAQQQRFELATGRYYLKTAQRRMQGNMKALWDNDDQLTNELANMLLKR